MTVTARSRARRVAAGFTLVEILVVITIIAALISIVAAVIPQAQQASRKVQCANNLKNIGTMLVQRMTSGKGMGTKGGSAMLLYTYKLGMIRKGDEKVFLCPGDIIVRQQNLDDPDFRKRYDNIDVNNIDPDIISYAGRNKKTHPIKADSREKQAWACDCQGADMRTGHHQGGLNVLFDDGSVEFKDHEALGIQNVDEPVVIGPDSNVEFLKQFIVVE